MPYCNSCGAKAPKDASYCQECGKELLIGTTQSKKKDLIKGQEPIEDDASSNEKNGKVIERVVEREYQQPRKGSGSMAAVIVIIVILAIIAFFVIGSGALDDLTKGSGVSYVDPCERDFNQCNRGCGEGILNSICKEKCTYQYNRCRS